MRVVLFFSLFNTACLLVAQSNYNVYPLTKSITTYSPHYPPEVWKEIKNALEICLAQNPICDDQLLTSGLIFDKFYYAPAKNFFPKDLTVYDDLIAKANMLDSIGYSWNPQVLLLLTEDITPVSEFCEDGNYEMYYCPFYDRSKKQWIYNQVYSQFSLKGGMFDGEVMFFSPFGDTLIKGQYLNGKRNGIWSFLLPFDIEKNLITFWSDETENYCRYKIEYLNGQTHGEYSFHINDVLRAEGFLINEVPVGKWKIYHSNGSISNDFFLTNNPTRMIELDRDFPTRNGELPFGPSQMFIPGYFDLTHYGDITLSRSDSDGYLVTNINGRFLAYYDDGAIMCDIVYENGTTRGDTVYYKSGFPMYIWKVNKTNKKGKILIFNESGLMLRRLKVNLDV